MIPSLFHSVLSRGDATADRTLFPAPEFLSMPAVGVDVANDTIRCLALEHGEGEYAVAFHAEYPIPKGTLSGGEIKNLDAVAEQLRRVRETHRFRFAHAALPEERAYLFQTEVPRLSDKAEVHSMLEFRLEENVPLQPQNALFDYEVLSKSPNGGYMLNVVAFPRDTVESYTAAFKRAGITLLSLETEAHAVARAVVPEGDDNTYLILDIGASAAHVVIVSGGKPQFTSTIEVGGDTLVGIVANGFNVASDQAELILKQRTLHTIEKDNPAIYQALTQHISILATEVGRYVSYWQSRVKDSVGKRVPVVQLIVCGGGANMAELPSLLSTTVGIPVRRCNVWENVLSFDEAVPPIDYEHSLSYGVAIGLALKSIHNS